ncbi:MAG: M16 family metallopeptidase [Pseudanabaenaceae cyanobacterium]
MNLHRQVWPNGITVLVLVNSTMDIVAGRLFVVGGSRCDGDRPGIGQLLAAVLTRGSTTANAREIADTVESLGAGLGTEVQPDYFLVRFKGVSEDWPVLLRLAGDLVRWPTFPRTEVELERRLLLEAIHQRQTQSLAVAWDALRPHLYGAHPYGQPELGTPEAITALAAAELQAHHRRWFQPNRLIVVLVGRLEPEAVWAQIDQQLGDWQGTAPPIPTAPREHRSVAVWVEHEHPQNTVLWGWPAPAIGHADGIAFHLLSVGLGDGPSSRLFGELREKRGLAYDVAAMFPWRAESSHLLAYVSTAPADAETASAVLAEAIQRWQTEPLSEGEWQMLQSKVLGQQALRCQTNGQWAQFLGWREAMGLPLPWDRQFAQAVRQTTPQDLQRVAQTYLRQGSRAIAGSR